MKPTQKSSAFERLLESMTERTTAITTKTCVRAPIGCGKPIIGFKDARSQREYRISGLCQACQDAIFGP